MPDTVAGSIPAAVGTNGRTNLQLSEDDPRNAIPQFIAVTSEVNLFLVSTFQRHLTGEMKYAVINHLEELRSTIIPDLIELLADLPTRAE